jgi:hypothetical protein
MPARRNIKTVLGLCIRGCGWFFATVGLAFLLRWLLFKVSQLFGQVHSAPLELYGMVGGPAFVFGVACFLIARRLIAADQPEALEARKH